ERGEESFNQKLSEARARSVREMLERYGVSHSRLTSRGVGEQSPRAAGSSSGGLRENPRREFPLTRRAAPSPKATPKRAPGAAPARAPLRARSTQEKQP